MNDKANKQSLSDLRRMLAILVVGSIRVSKKCKQDYKNRTNKKESFKRFIQRWTKEFYERNKK